MRGTGNGRSFHNQRKANCRNEEGNMSMQSRYVFNFNVSEIDRDMDSTDNLEHAWTLDSGSTSHMTSNVNAMHNVKPCNVRISLAENNKEMKSS